MRALAFIFKSMKTPTKHFLHSPNARQLVISVKEARKILGKPAQTMNDNQVEDLICTLTSIADNFLHNIGSKV